MLLLPAVSGSRVTQAAHYGCCEVGNAGRICLGGVGFGSLDGLGYTRVGNTEGERKNAGKGRQGYLLEGGGGGGGCGVGDDPLSHRRQHGDVVIGADWAGCYKNTRAEARVVPRIARRTAEHTRAVAFSTSPHAAAAARHACMACGTFKLF